MNAQSRFHRIVYTAAAALLAFFAQSSPVFALPAVQKTFDTEILALHLQGTGQLPIPQPGGGFADVPVFLDISPEPGARHPGQMTVTPGAGPLHPIDSFFDVFFVARFTDPSSGRLLLPAIHDSLRITGNNMGAPDADGNFSPAGKYSGSGILDDVELLPGSFFDVSFRIELEFGGGTPPNPVKGGTLYDFDGTGEFTGHINPDFGPFQLTNAAGEPVQILVNDVPAPGTLALLGLALFMPMLVRRRARA